LDPKRYVLVTGEKGVGKSTLLSQFAKENPSRLLYISCPISFEGLI